MRSAAGSTAPAAATKGYRRTGGARPQWGEYVDADGQSYVAIGNEGCYLSVDGLLMPQKQDQPPPER